VNSGRAAAKNTMVFGLVTPTTNPVTDGPQGPHGRYPRGQRQAIDCRCRIA
jgi:hypothetical protein